MHIKDFFGGYNLICIYSSLGWGRAPVVPPGHLRYWTRVHICSQNPALSDLRAQTKSPRSGGPFRSSNARWIPDLRQWRWPGKEWYQHEDLEARGGTIRHLQSPDGRIHWGWHGSHRPTFPGPSSLLPHGQKVPQGCKKEACEGSGGLSSEHKGGGLYRASGEKPQQQALLCKKRQRLQQEPRDLQGQWGQGQTGQSGGQTAQQSEWRHWSLTF